MNKTPYLHVVDEPRMMAGKGAPRSTVFGVLGITKEDSEMRSLGGLVKSAKASAPAPPLKTPSSLIPPNSERSILGKASKTHIPGEHFGMTPYPGAFMSRLGQRL